MIKIGNAMDVLKAMEGEKVHAVITSPPYWGLRAYGTNPQVWDDGWVGELGSEPTPEMFIEHIADIFDEVKRVLRPDGVCWINIGDSYASSINGTDVRTARARGKDDSTYRDKPFSTVVSGLKAKDLCLIPQRLAIELQRRGWWIRSFFTWWKGSAMPESTKDRPANSHEWIIMATKRKSYWYDIDAERVAQSNLPQTVARREQADNSVRTRAFSRNIGNVQTLPNGRNLRTGDFMQMSLDAEIENTRNHLKSLHDIKRKGGIIHDGNGVPTGLFCNPKGFKESHFATFPPRFVEILLNLSVPKKACAECDKGWKRVVEKGAFIHTGGGANKNKRSDSMDKGANMPIDMPSGLYQAKTLGFVPDCECDAAHHLDADKICTVCGANSFKSAVEPCWIAGVVLDPFIGAGTVGLVAQRFGRQWIGIELSEIYAAMADKRIESENQLDIF